MASPARTVAFRLLRELEAGRRDRLGPGLDEANLDPRERPLARELCLGVERQRALLDHVLEGYLDRGLPTDPGARTVLRLGAHQILFNPGIPGHAAVFETVALAGRFKGLANAVLRRVSEAVTDGEDVADDAQRVSLPDGRMVTLVHPLPDPTTDLPAWLAVRYTLPEFLTRSWVERFGPETAREIALASSKVPDVFLRTARASIDARSLGDELGADGVEVEAAEHPRVLRWTGGRSPFSSTAFGEGRFVVQDPTAVVAAEAVGALLGETVLDLCAAPGTKASLLADAVGEDGLVLAYDADENRREPIVETATRLGLPALAVLDRIDGLEPVDRALVDVPCSNTGVLARRVEVRRRLSAKGIHALTEVQRGLLQQAVGLVRPGGTVVYSTCSIEAEENEQIVDAVLAQTPGLERVAQALTLPATPDHDGGFHAVLRVGTT